MNAIQMKNVEACVGSSKLPLAELTLALTSPEAGNKVRLGPTVHILITIVPWNIEKGDIHVQGVHTKAEIRVQGVLV